MPAPQEIELKLLVPGLSADTALQRLRRTPSLRRRTLQQQQLLNRYFDTPDQALQRQRCALRLRHVSAGTEPGPLGTGTAPTPEHGSHGAWRQTLKTAGTSQGGLSQRGEWENVVTSGVLDAAALQGTAWDQLDPSGSLFATLQPCFETHCLRTTWRVRQRNGADIEVALDAGTVQAGRRTEPLLELELELISGPPAALFTLAQELAQHLPLLPSDVSKAQRGYALAAQTPATAVRAQPVPLKKNLPPLALATPVLAEILQQLYRNLEGLLQHDDPELVHQARVAWRRWRSVTRLLRPWLPPLPDTSTLQPLLHQLSTLRDLDVARHDTLPAWAHGYLADNPGVPNASETKAAATSAAATALTRQAHWSAVLDALNSAAQHARQQVRHTLATPGAGSAFLTLTAWLHALPAHAAIPTAEPKKSWATQRLARWHRRMKQLVQAAHANPTLLHRARLLAKRLRYSSEAIASALPADAARRSRRWTRQASGWQLRIGQQRDLWQAIHLLEQLPGPTSHAEVAAFLRGVAAGST